MLGWFLFTILMPAVVLKLGCRTVRFACDVTLFVPISRSPSVTRVLAVIGAGLVSPMGVFSIVPPSIVNAGLAAKFSTAVIRESLSFTSVSTASKFALT